MRRALLAFLLLALVLPVAAFGSDSPSPSAVAKCQAEYAALGADAFRAKYGASEPFGHCYQANAGTTTAATTTTTTNATTPSDNPVAAACKAEYAQRGADAFKAKYGANEPFGACVKAHAAGARPSGSGDTNRAPDSPVVAACKAEYAQLGADAFKAKYGSEPLGACVRAHGGTSSSGNDQGGASDNPAVAACKAEYTSLGADAFKAKYGSNPLGACVRAHGGTAPTTPPNQPNPPSSNGDDGASSVAGALCQSEAKALGKELFMQKYGGREAMGACVQAALAKAKSLIA